MRNKLIFLNLSVFLSLLGWFNYAKLLYITSVHSYFTFEQYNSKYFKHYPWGLKDINIVNVFTILVLGVAIALLIFLIIKTRKLIRILSYVIGIIDAIVFSGLVVAYM